MWDISSPRGIIVYTQKDIQKSVVTYFSSLYKDLGRAKIGYQPECVNTIPLFFQEKKVSY